MAALHESVLNCEYLTERLFVFICGGEDLVIIQSLLQEGVDIDARNSEGYTPLLLACLQQRKELVDLLIKSGANVDVEFNGDWTVLHCAAKNAWIKTVRTLVKKMPDLDARDIRGDTAMHHASRSGCLKTVRCLVEKGPDINMENAEAFTPLLCAAECSRLDVFDLLLNSRANVDGYEKTLLYLSARNGWTRAVHFLLKKVPDVNENLFNMAPLHVASNNGRLELVKYLVGEGCDINKRSMDGLTALQYATLKGHLEVVKWLGEKGTNISIRDCNGETALHPASRRGYLEIVKYLVERGADINIKGMWGGTPVIQAAHFSRRDVVDFLIQCGANVEDSNDNMLTLLHLASARGWIEIVQYIARQNVDLGAKDIHGFSALLFACAEEKFDVVQYLLQTGARWDVLGKDGNSSLSCIASKPAILKLFIENGAFLKRVDYEAILKSSSLEVLQDVELCCQAIVNKFNNHELPELYKLPASGNLPRIEEIKIARGSEVAQAIKQTVEYEIQTKGHCNILEVRPMVLSLFCVRSILEYNGKKKSELRNCLKRPAAFDPCNECQHSSKVMCLS